MTLKNRFYAYVTALLSSVAAANSPDMHALDGIWKSEGYGYLFEISENHVSIYEQSQLSCLQSGLAAGALSKYNNKTPYQASFPVAIAGFIDADMQIFPGQNDDEKRFHRSDTNTFITVKRQQVLPETCRQPAPADARSVYAVFKQSFAEHYPFFQHKNISWDKAAIDASLSGKALFNALVALVHPLRDSHIAVVAPSLDGYYFGSEEFAQNPESSNKATLADVLADYLGASKLQSFCHQQIQYANLNDNIGYLAVNGFGQYSEQGNFDADLKALTDAIDGIFQPHKRIRGLILDVRNNNGGSDRLAIELASRFTAEPYRAYAKQAVKATGSGIQWTQEHVTWVTPNNPAFIGPIVLLTGQNSISAAETFTMALMDRKPEVTRMGNNTRGSFSDMLPRTLPNGWLFSLPNERYLDSNGISYDITGIPPQVVLSADETDKAVIDNAMSLLNKKLNG